MPYLSRIIVDSVATHIAYDTLVEEDHHRPRLFLIHANE
jgi:hypothetical protein